MKQLDGSTLSMGTFTIHHTMIKEIIMGDIFTWNSLSKLMAGKEGADMLFGVIRYFFGKSGQPTGSSHIGHDDGMQSARDDGKGNVDEHNALVALAEAHFGKALNDMDQEEYEVTRTRFSKLMAIFKALREQGRVGGAEKLMHIIGHESHLQGTVVAPRTPPKGQKPEDQQPQRIDIHNVRERTNPAGKLIIRFLADLETQQAVGLLVSLSITDNGKDKATATANAAADKLAAITAKLRKWYGDNETSVHIFLAQLATDRQTVEMILASRQAQEYGELIEAATTPEEKRERKEAFEAFLLKAVKLSQHPNVQADEARIAGRRTTQESNRRLSWIFVAVIVGSCVVLGIAAKLN